jgi:hypothetical protein
VWVRVPPSVPAVENKQLSLFRTTQESPSFNKSFNTSPRVFAVPSVSRHAMRGVERPVRSLALTILIPWTGGIPPRTQLDAKPLRRSAPATRSATPRVSPRTAYGRRMDWASRIAKNVLLARVLRERCLGRSLPSIESAHLNRRWAIVGTLPFLALAPPPETP